MKYKQILVSGKVQGVGFRDFLRREVSLIGGLVGYAKNLKDGNVEIVVLGDEEKIKKLAEKCKKGPLLSSVTGVSISEIEIEEDYDSFVIRM